MKQVFILLALVCSTAIYASNTPDGNVDPLEIQLVKSNGWNLEVQRTLSNESPWLTFKQNHDKWQVLFNEETGMPHRAYGNAIPVIGNDGVEKALNFLSEEAQMFGVDPGQLELVGVNKSDQYDYINFVQKLNGTQIFQSRVTVKIHQNGVVMFGMDYYADASITNSNALDLEEVVALAEADMVQTILETVVQDDLLLIPVQTEEGQALRLVREVLVKTVNDNNIPANYLTFIDAENGTIWQRTNTVMHCLTCKKPHNIEPEKKVLTMGMPPVSGVVEAELYPINTIEGTEVLELPYLSINIDGEQYYTDVNGNFDSPENGTISGQFKLEGLYADVNTSGNTPSFNVMLDEGSNNVSFDGEANLKELSAYRSTNIIHDHMKTVFPDYTGLDYSLPVNIDVAGECNAFYDGSSINFFDQGGGCTATSLVADVVYHEYGHGINGHFYGSNGQGFWNGSMNEGYADFWAISYSHEPNFAQDFFAGSTNGLRRYDINPKVLGEDDIPGDVHNNGEIICGAWYDSHVLMGEDWDLTMDLWAEAFMGWQATEGDIYEAYHDVLLDVLQADDDNGDLTDGTPNDLAIIEGFDIHGISLLSTIDMYHENVLVAEGEVNMHFEAEVDVEFPASIYLDGVYMYYQINDNTGWLQTEMVNMNGDTYAAEIPAVDPGTLITYYIGLEDIDGDVSSALPAGVLGDDPTLPYFTIVGSETVLLHDSDNNSEFGIFETGIDEDNATAGIWELASPIPSFTNDDEIAAPDEDHTPDGEMCFVTANSTSPSAPQWDNDVDDGWTTLRSPVIDLSMYDHPMVSYWRWLVNDHESNVGWIVEVSDNGGLTWTDIESTNTQDIQWRRNVIRVEDHIEVNDQFRIQFIAADPIFEGSGALVEAAVDDIFVWDAVESSVSVSELDNPYGVQLFPNPMQEQLTITSEKGQIQRVELISMTGQIIMSATPIGEQVELDVEGLSAGMYSARIVFDDEIVTRLVIK